MTNERREISQEEWYGRTLPVVPQPPSAPSKRPGAPGTELQRRVEGLCQQLQHTLQGEVHFDSAHRAMYSADSSNYRFVPLGVVYPESLDDVVEAVKTAHQFGVPIVHRGAGTSLAGQTVNAGLCIVSKPGLEKFDIDPSAKTVTVYPGAIADKVREAAEEYGLTYSVDPGTHEICTFGGMLGNNSGGIHAQMGGGITVDFVEEIEVVTYDGARFWVGPTTEEELDEIIAAGGRKGEIYARLRDLRDRYADQIREKYPDREKFPRFVSGYNLYELLPENGFNVARALVGSEGTCATILRARMRLIKGYPYQALCLLNFCDVPTAAEWVMRIREYDPIALEGMDPKLLENNRKKGINLEDADQYPVAGGYLIVEFGGDTKAEAMQKAEHLAESLEPGTDGYEGAMVIGDRFRQNQIWKIRESGLGSGARIPGEGDSWPGWEDTAVAIEDLGDYLRDLKALFDKYGYQAGLYGHFGQGLVHCRINFDLKSDKGVRDYREFIEEASDVIVDKYQGSYTGEHGDGQARGELLVKRFGPELMDAMHEFRAIWDPDGMMNPGKAAAYARPLDADLRLGADYEPWEPETHFKFPEDDGKFSRATLRCVGVGKCLRDSGGTMCPSHMVTHQEKHATRGRTRLLFEMLNGEETPTSWDNEDVREALDLCLSCKGCLNDCPVNVDMATYKAEFLSHYYEHHMRPVASFSMGLIDQWARIASTMPQVVNTLGRTPIIADLGKRALGIATQRTPPRFASQTFKDWFKDHPSTRTENAPPMVLFADTFNNHFHTGNLKAAARVFEALGYDVHVPQAHLCCGRPLYDYGMLDTAEKYLNNVMNGLQKYIDDDIPMVVLEPSCAAVFRDELVNLMPDDARAQKLCELTHTFGEFLEKVAPDKTLPKLEMPAKVHTHCHHTSALGVECERKVMKRMNLDFEVLDTGCCGMAGSFGFEAGEKYDISKKVYEHDLQKKLKQKLETGDLLIADGFSCRTQIQEFEGRKANHLAQVVYLAMFGGEQ